jgi:hydroxymethylbilane synthase
MYRFRERGAGLPFLRQRKSVQASFRLRIREQGERGGDRLLLRFLLRRLHVSQLRRVRALMPRIVRIGTRGSKLARWQADWIKNALKGRFPSLSFELVIISTQGDRILDVPLAKIGGKGLFVKEIEEALLDRRIDVAVHSMKDMPAEVPPGLCIGAIPERESPADVLISREGKRFSELLLGSRIGTSSLRRSAQLRHARPDIEIRPLRGNIDTRVRKLETGEMDAIVLAAAGISRLGMEARITEYLSDAVMLPAVGQGALCVETRADDSEILPLISTLDHLPTRRVVTGERAFLKRLQGGCQVPIAGLGKIEENIFSLSGLVAEVDGSILLKETISGSPDDSERLGIALADRLLGAGGRTILEKLQTDPYEIFES